MNASIAERLIVPAVVEVVVATLSGGLMAGVRGATKRMRLIWLSAMFWNACLLYSIAWKDKLASVFGSEEAWVFVAALLGVITVFACRRFLERQSNLENEQDSDP